MTARFETKREGLDLQQVHDDVQWLMGMYEKLKRAGKLRSKHPMTALNSTKRPSQIQQQRIANACASEGFKAHKGTWKPDTTERMRRLYGLVMRNVLDFGVTEQYLAVCDWCEWEGSKH